MPARPDAARRFKAMHAASKGFILPNAWDAGTACVITAQGFRAIATTSAGIAFSMGQPDYQVADPSRAVTRDQMFERIGEILAAVEVPVSADLEAGYGDRPEEVAQTVRMAVAAGLAGGNIEDKIPGRPTLYDEALAVERIVAARAAAGPDFVLNARTDALLQTEPDLDLAIRRGRLFLQAGADCVFVPGTVDPAKVSALVAGIPGPVNIVMGLGTSAGNAHELIALGAQRITVGGSLARAALGFVRDAAKELLGDGTVGYSQGQISAGELAKLFGDAA